MATNFEPSLCLLLLLPFLSSVRGEIQCACTTSECIAQGQQTCEAKYYCFVAFRISRKQPFPTARGCIDDETPLNCAGVLPNYLDGPDSRWSHMPVMYCCSDSWCNTAKHMARQSRRKRPRSRLPLIPGDDPLPTPRPSPQPGPKSSGDSRSSDALIAIPVVAAVLVLALFVLIVFLVKRKDARNRARAVSKYYSVPASVTAGVKPVELMDNSCNYYEDNPIPLYASVGHKPAYPLCPVVPRTPV